MTSSDSARAAYSAALSAWLCKDSPETSAALEAAAARLDRLMAVEAQLDPARRLWAWVAGLLRRVFGRSVRVPYSKVVADYHSAAAQFLLDPTDIDVGREFDSAAEELLRRGF